MCLGVALQRKVACRVLILQFDYWGTWATEVQARQAHNAAVVLRNLTHALGGECCCDMLGLKYGSSSTAVTLWHTVCQANEWRAGQLWQPRPTWHL